MRRRSTAPCYNKNSRSIRGANMVRPKPWIKFTVKDYMSTPEGERYQLLDGEMILAPAPYIRHQRILGRLWRA